LHANLQSGLQIDSYCDLLLASEVLHIPCFDLFAQDTLGPLLASIEVMYSVLLLVLSLGHSSHSHHSHTSHTPPTHPTYLCHIPP
jgi:hypothetical protein